MTSLKVGKMQETISERTTKGLVAGKPARTSLVSFLGSGIASEGASHVDDLRYPVNAVSRAVRILHYVSDSPVPVRAIHVARDLRLNVSTCFNILKTLANDGLVEFEPNDKTYSIGTGILVLAKRLLANERALAVAEPLMERIGQKHRVTVALTRKISKDRIAAVSLSKSDGPLRIYMRMGERLPLFTGGVGRIMAAHSDLDLASLKRQFELMRWSRPLTFGTFMSQVDAAKKRGWAITDGYSLPGTVVVSVPVLDRRGEVPYGCSAVMFSGQRNPKKVSQVVRDLAGLASVIERNLTA